MASSISEKWVFQSFSSFLTVRDCTRLAPTSKVMHCSIETLYRAINLNQKCARQAIAFLRPVRKKEFFPINMDEEELLSHKNRSINRERVRAVAFIICHLNEETISAIIERESPAILLLKTFPLRIKNRIESMDCIGSRLLTSCFNRAIELNDPDAAFAIVSFGSEYQMSDELRNKFLKNCRNSEIRQILEECAEVKKGAKPVNHCLSDCAVL